MPISSLSLVSAYFSKGLGLQGFHVSGSSKEKPAREIWVSSVLLWQLEEYEQMAHHWSLDSPV